MTKHLIDPNNTLVLVNKGIALSHQCMIEDAISHYDKAIELNPRESIALTQKGIALSRLGALDEAKEYVDKSLQINSRDYIALAWRGNYAEIHENNMYAVRDYYEKAIALNPRDYITKTKLRIIQRKIEEAERQGG
jgi:tetratricopeptide (TPR) repeat protein